MTEKKTKSDIQVEATFTLSAKATAPEIYADGVTQLMLGFPMTKILFHTVVSPAQGETPEGRKAVAHISMQTTAAIELANLILGVCKESEDYLLNTLDTDGVGKLKALLADIKVDKPPKGFQASK